MIFDLSKNYDMFDRHADFKILELDTSLSLADEVSCVKTVQSVFTQQPIDDTIGAVEDFTQLFLSTHSQFWR